MNRGGGASSQVGGHKGPVLWAWPLLTSPLAVSFRAGADTTVSGGPRRGSGGCSAAAGTGGGPRASGPGRTNARGHRPPAEPLGSADTTRRSEAARDTSQRRDGCFRACADGVGKRAVAQGRGSAALPDVVSRRSLSWRRGRSTNPDFVG